jgi:predicted Zn-dependent protease
MDTSKHPTFQEARINAMQQYKKHMQTGHVNRNGGVSQTAEQNNNHKHEWRREIRGRRKTTTDQQEIGQLLQGEKNNRTQTRLGPAARALLRVSTAGRFRVYSFSPKMRILKWT